MVGAVGAGGGCGTWPSLDFCAVVVLVSRWLLSSSPQRCLAAGLLSTQDSPWRKAGGTGRCWVSWAACELGLLWAPSPVVCLCSVGISPPLSHTPMHTHTHTHTHIHKLLSLPLSCSHIHPHNDMPLIQVHYLSEIARARTSGTHTLTHTSGCMQPVEGSNLHAGRTLPGFLYTWGVPYCVISQSRAWSGLNMRCRWTSRVETRHSSDTHITLVRISSSPRISNSPRAENAWCELGRSALQGRRLIPCRGERYRPTSWPWPLSGTLSPTASTPAWITLHKYIGQADFHRHRRGVNSFGSSFCCSIRLLVPREADMRCYPLKANFRTAGNQLTCSCHDLTHKILPCVSGQ